MKTHVAIAPDRLKNLSRPESVDGVEMVVTLSPYTTPRAAWGRCSSATDQIVIGFDYLDREPVGKRAVIEGIEFAEGKYSGKILSVAIPLSGLSMESAEIEQLKRNVLAALQQQTASLGDKTDRILNHQVVHEVIENDLERLIRDCQATF